MTMSIRFRCESCGQTLVADEQMKKLPAKCPGCAQWVTVPETSSLPPGNQDIEFNCGKCAQSLVIDAAGAGLVVQCPTCGNSVTVPQREHPDLVPVPEWNSYYPELESASSPQKAFYKYWCKQIEQGSFPPLAGNLGYIFVYLYAAIDDFKSDGNIERLLARFDPIRRGYADIEKVTDYVRLWTSDAYLAVGDYDTAWAYRKGYGMRVFDFLAIRSKCRETTIDGEDIVSLLVGDHDGLTPFGKARMPEIITRATRLLEILHHQCGKNFVDHFVHQFNFSDITETDMERLKQSFSNEQDFELWRNLYFKDKHRYPGKGLSHHLFGGVPSFGRRQSTATFTIHVGGSGSEPVAPIRRGPRRPENAPATNIEVESIPMIIEVALLEELKGIFRECENALREEADIPRVGEGWWSETELFYKLRQAFPDEIIVHHGRPAWLAPQHLDIYFPKGNIACEYQGKQHQSAVGYFGGAEAFEKQQQRDAKKKRLCDEHSCLLLYVYEGYDFEKLKNEIMTAMIHA
jgi:DNA-directed RNA polymerase subunit RPC12/RpoP